MKKPKVDGTEEYNYFVATSYCNTIHRIVNISRLFVIVLVVGFAHGPIPLTDIAHCLRNLCCPSLAAESIAIICTGLVVVVPGIGSSNVVADPVPLGIAQFVCNSIHDVIALFVIRYLLEYFLQGCLIVIVFVLTDTPKALPLPCLYYQRS